MTIEVFISSRLLINTEIAITMSSFSDARLTEKKRNRKSNFVVFFFSNILLLTEKKKNRESNFVVLFFSKMLFSIEEKKNWKITFVNFFFDRISSSFSLTSSFIVFESLFASQSTSSWFSSTLENMIMMSETLLKNEDCFTIHHCESLLTELIHNVSSSFVLSFDSIFFVMFTFVSFSFVFIVFASSFNAFRFRKKAHESFSSTLKKKNRLTNDHCDCTLSSKWLEDLKKARCIENVKRIEHF